VRDERVAVSLGDGGVRIRLAELAGLTIPQESEERIAETQAYRRRAAEKWQQL
jgi:hypothetical protein